MRLSSLRPTWGPVALAVLAAGLLLFPGPAGGQNGHGLKVDDSVAAVADAPGTTSDTELHVIIYGTALDEVNAAGMVKVRNLLGLTGGESAIIKVADLGELASHPGVTYITRDNPVVSTDDPPPSEPCSDGAHADGAPSGRSGAGGGPGAAVRGRAAGGAGSPA